MASTAKNSRVAEGDRFLQPDRRVDGEILEKLAHYLKMAMRRFFYKVTNLNKLLSRNFHFRRTKFYDACRNLISNLQQFRDNAQISAYHVEHCNYLSFAFVP